MSAAASTAIAAEQALIESQVDRMRFLIDTKGAVGMRWKIGSHVIKQLEMKIDFDIYYNRIIKTRIYWMTNAAN